MGDIRDKVIIRGLMFGSIIIYIFEHALHEPNTDQITNQKSFFQKLFNLILLILAE